jgi:hypothetical protein
MILTNQKEAALNAVLIALYHAADHYQQSVELLENQAPADFFARLLHLRRAAAARTTELLRSLNFLPAEPDPDRLALTELATLVKAALSRDIESILVKKALQLETHIQSRLDDALPLEWSDPVRTALEHMHVETMNEIERLQTR